jgi:hypothetical protein
MENVEASEKPGCPVKMKPGENIEKSSWMINIHSEV